MNLNPLTTKTELKVFLKGIFEPHVTALQGIMDKLPDALKPDFQKLKSDLNAQLEKLAPLDQVPAALDASYALQSLSGALERIQEYATELTKRLSAMTQSLADKATALQGFEDKLKAGALITKEAATELCGAARTEALNSVKPTIASMRKQQIELAGLPVPAEELLGLPEADYTPRFDAAKANVEALTKRGLKVGGKGSAIVKDLAWLPAAEFNGKLTSYADVLGGERPAADPLLGAGATAGEAAAVGTPAAADKAKAARFMW
jgi:hypothetical protein